VEETSCNIIRFVRNKDPSRRTEAVVFDSCSCVKIEPTGSEGRYSIGFYTIRIVGGLVEIRDNNDNLLFREIEFKTQKDRAMWSHVLVEDARLYGFGGKDGPLDKRKWRRIVLRNTDPTMRYRSPEADPLYLNIPFYIMAKKGYAVGVYIDSPSYMEVHIDKKKGVITVEKIGTDLDVYIILGSSVKEVLDGYVKITGKPYMPPLWVLGFHQSKWSYKSEEEVMFIAKKFREYNIPCDAIHLDIDYMDGFKPFTWHPGRFPNPKHMIEQLHSMGFKVVVIVDPYIKIDDRDKLFLEGINKDYFVKDKKGGIFVARGWPGKSAMPNFLREEVRKWWGELYLRFYREYGVDGFKNDMNEPSTETRLRSYLGLGVKPKNMVFCRNGECLEIEKVGNIYALLECMGVYSTLRKTGRRFFILSRSGFAGIQRYSANWTGDIWSTWRHIRASVSMLLNMSLSGLFFIGADIGGFFPPFKKTNRKLYLRWIQLGVFYPFMRAHYAKARPPQEPWCFGKEALEIARRYIELRYSLLPYIYSLFRRAHIDGELIFRPLFYDFPYDEKAYDIDDQFMFGPSILVAPILHRKDQREIYLPGGYWLDYWSGEVYSGPKSISYTADLSIIPIFVRDGGILVFQEPQRYVGEKKVEKYDILVFSKERAGEFVIYEDDGISYDFERGIYTETKIMASPTQIQIKILHRGYEGVQHLRLRIFMEMKPKEVILDDSKYRFSYHDRWLEIETTKTNHEIRIEI